jgi:hypothetical protein
VKFKVRSTFEFSIEFSIQSRFPSGSLELTADMGDGS